MRKLCGGAPPLQCLHDIGTLNDQMGYNCIGVAYVKDDWTGVDVWCIGVNPLSDGKTDVQVEEDVRNTMERCTGDPVLKNSCNSTVADGAAQGVARKAGFEEDPCDLHQHDKIGKSCVGDLVRTVKKQVVNPFPDAQDILKKAGKILNIMRFRSRQKYLWEWCAKLGIKKLCYVNFNTTRFTSRHSMMYRFLMLSAPLTHLLADPPQKECFDSAPEFTELADYCPLRHMEGVLCIVRIFTTMSQCEKYIVRGIRPVCKVMLMNTLRADTILVLKKDMLAKGKAERMQCPVEQLCDVGKQCLRRAIIEAEHRVCTNDTRKGSEGEPTGTPVVWSDTDVIAFFCDPLLLMNGKLHVGFSSRIQNGEFSETFYNKAHVPMWEQHHGAIDGGGTDDEGEGEGEGESAFEVNFGMLEDDERAVERKDLCRGEFVSQFKAWCALSKEVVAALEKVTLNPRVAQPVDPEDDHDDEPIDVTMVEATLWRLIKFDISPYMLRAERDERTHGLFPKIARVHLCRLMSESFCERVISYGGNVSSKVNTTADHEHTGNRVVCHMNRKHKGDISGLPTPVPYVPT